MSTDLEPRHFSSPLAIFFVLNSEEKHISHISKNIFIKMGEYFLWKGLWRMLLISAIGWLPGCSDRIFFFPTAQTIFYLQKQNTEILELSCTTLSNVTNISHMVFVLCLLLC